MISPRNIFLLVVCVCCIAAQKLANPQPASLPTGVKNTAKDTTLNTQNLPVNRAAATRVFANAGKKEGIEIWRIEVSLSFMN